MKLFRTALLASSLIAIASPAVADDRADMEKFMNDYLVLWNAHDATAITSDYYRLDGAHPWSKAEGLKAEFDRLKSQGYTTSDIHSVIGCSLGPDTGQVELRFTRLTADGGFMPPKDRTSLYKVRKFEDGWRVTSLGSLPAGTRMDCPK